MIEVVAVSRRINREKARGCPNLGNYSLLRNPYENTDRIACMAFTQEEFLQRRGSSGGKGRQVPLRSLTWRA
jgi:hypothetical protein